MILLFHIFAAKTARYIIYINLVWVSNAFNIARNKSFPILGSVFFLFWCSCNFFCVPRLQCLPARRPLYHFLTHPDLAMSIQNPVSSTFCSNISLVSGNVSLKFRLWRQPFYIQVLPWIFMASKRNCHMRPSNNSKCIFGERLHRNKINKSKYLLALKQISFPFYLEPRHDLTNPQYVPCS